ncbi:tRNA pseudouridine(55) synthase TruB [Mangrovibacterium diazotrophicum]|uniref:tRNA pseudouridine synthase B n=1 Tax=Mangrovibacterium diazotrophicum TaxID=1261403 RepID=A0A419WAU3_9BACT|nr:tRNA pseudouridine(55) synthase TruB [Mangrovibacterium diazotrophicum]RKD92588.1 tRNA pseudouridine55 synthase [Mangrovibacterium diazotrophicum]
MGDTARTYDFEKGEVLLFDKALDWTSFDLVRKVRNHLTRAIGVKKLKVGHAGTLDPKATGLMILCTGKATKSIDSIQAQVKEYVATIKLGATTPSFDLESEEDATYPTSHITLPLIQEVLNDFKGEQMQVPPIFSAVKVDGKRAYEHARKGEDVKLNAKLIQLYELEVVEFDGTNLVLRVVCSKGTYIRALARDLGKALNSGAYLTGLRRTKVGDYQIGEAMSLEYFLENLNLFVTN